MSGPRLVVSVLIIYPHGGVVTAQYLQNRLYGLSLTHEKIKIQELPYHPSILLLCIYLDKNMV